MDVDGWATRDIELADGYALQIKEFSLLQDNAGAVVWDAGLVLAYYLAHQHTQGRCLVSGKTVLDLGSGTGVAGLAAGRLGAAAVLLSDLPHLLPYLRENIQLNSLGASCSDLPLEWGNAAHLATARSGALKRLPDIILASDIVYTAAGRAALFPTLAALMAPAPPQPPQIPGGADVHISASAVQTAGRNDGSGDACGGCGEGLHGGTLAIISFEQRPGVEELPGLCAAQGLEVWEVPLEHLHPAWRSEDIHVLHVRKRSTAGQAAGGDAS